MNRRAAIASLSFVFLSAANADGPPISIQFGIGAAPPVYAPVPPSMVWLPELGMYVALGVDRPVFYLGGVYYFNDAGIWYSGPRYGGPWSRMQRPPQYLQRVQPRDWDRYQAEARRHADDSRWRHFRAAPQFRGHEMRPQPRGPEMRAPQRDQRRDQWRDQRRDDRRGDRRDDHRDDHGR